jgi:hypothetical protein
MQNINAYLSGLTAECDCGLRIESKDDDLCHDCKGALNDEIYFCKSCYRRERIPESVETLACCVHTDSCHAAKKYWGLTRAPLEALRAAQKHEETEVLEHYKPEDWCGSKDGVHEIYVGTQYVGRGQPPAFTSNCENCTRKCMLRTTKVMSQLSVKFAVAGNPSRNRQLELIGVRKSLPVSSTDSGIACNPGE